MTKYKSYKACSPEETVFNIRRILHGLGIVINEKSYSKDGLYACRLTINNEGLSRLNIGTNGKGRSYEYALASGYAELMERLQCGLLLKDSALQYLSEDYLGSLPDDSKFKKFFSQQEYQVPDMDVEAVSFSLDEIWFRYSKDLMDMFPSASSDEEIKSCLSELLGGKDIKCLPVYSYLDKKVIPYPMDLVFLGMGSNGMCAGNCPEEALLQGFCEVFERYAMREVFVKKMTPPTIPLEKFIGTSIYDKIKDLEKVGGYEFIIKDCSLGIGLPVIGVIILDRENGKYNFKLGSDFVPHIALERCITETYQSNQGAIMLPILHNAGGDVESEYYKALANGTGQWPDSIFMDTPSYAFSGINEKLGLSNSSDLAYACDLVTSLGGNLYIRDNSYLGFPAYSVIAPSLGGVQLSLNRLITASKNSPECLGDKLLHGKIESFRAMIDHMAKAVEYNQDNGDRFDFNAIIPFCCEQELQDVDANLFLCMAYYMKRDYTRSLEYLEQFLCGKDYEDSYYFAVADYIRYLIIEGKSPQDVSALLTKKYGGDISGDIFEDMEDPDNIFKYYDFPRRFNVDSWIEDDSLFVPAIKLLRRLYLFRRDHVVDQDNLSVLFG
ncbi:MAG: YcaO-like family protein [Bacteroidales bacterium]|nr:YcaO-like family protein [Bacteroidales bacterium]